MSRGIISLVWRGECDPTNVLTRCLASTKHWHPELEHRVIEMPTGSNLLCKSQMYDLSPFDETLFLDADTTVMGRLDYGFDKANQFGIACCINANPWQRRYYKIDQHPDEVEYSSGVVFFNKKWFPTRMQSLTANHVKDVFWWWNQHNRTEDTRSRFLAADGVKEQTYNDQALFTLAMHRAQFNPFVLPLNWNIYPRWQKHFWGEIKIVHGYFDIPQSIMQWNAEQSQPDAVIKCAAWPEVK